MEAPINDDGLLRLTLRDLRHLMVLVTLIVTFRVGGYVFQDRANGNVCVKVDVITERVTIFGPRRAFYSWLTFGRLFGVLAIRHYVTIEQRRALNDNRSDALSVTLSQAALRRGVAAIAAEHAGRARLVGSLCSGIVLIKYRLRTPAVRLGIGGRELAFFRGNCSAVITYPDIIEVSFRSARIVRVRLDNGLSARLFDVTHRGRR